MSELASSYNSSTSGDAMGLYPSSHGTTSPNVFPTFPGTSPPQQISWGGIDMLSSSPLTGPGATFQSLRGRPSSFDHGKSFCTDAQVTCSPGGGSSTAMGLNMLGGVIFDELPLSPFVTEMSDDQTAEDLGAKNNAPGQESDEHLNNGFSTHYSREDSDYDDEEDDMMFKLEGSVSKTDDFNASAAPAVQSQHELLTLPQLLSNLPSLSSFPSVNAYVSTMKYQFVYCDDLKFSIYIFLKGKFSGNFATNAQKCLIFVVVKI